VRQNRGDDLGLALEGLVEQRTDGTVDEAGNERFLLARTPLALEVSAGDLARGVGLLLIVHRQGEEVQPRLRRLLRHHGGQHGRLSIGGQNRAVGLTGDVARLQFQGPAAPLDFFGMNVKHLLFSCVFLHVTFRHA